MNKGGRYLRPEYEGGAVLIGEVVRETPDEELGVDRTGMRGRVLTLLNGKVEGDRLDSEPLRSVVGNGRPSVTKDGLRTSRVSKIPEEITHLNK